MFSKQYKCTLTIGYSYESIIMINIRTTAFSFVVLYRVSKNIYVSSNIKIKNKKEAVSLYNLTSK